MEDVARPDAALEDPVRPQNKAYRRACPNRRLRGRRRVLAEQARVSGRRRTVGESRGMRKRPGRTPPREAAFNHEAAPRFRVRARHEPARMEAMARVVFDWSHKNRFVLALADKSHICRGVPRTAADDAARLRSRLT